LNSRSAWSPSSDRANNDDADVYPTAYGPNVLYRNNRNNGDNGDNGDGTFEDVTAREV
jgi:hypothetical protein